jgi:hypothetical protein
MMKTHAEIDAVYRAAVTHSHDAAIDAVYEAGAEDARRELRQNTAPTPKPSTPPPRPISTHT